MAFSPQGQFKPAQHHRHRATCLVEHDHGHGAVARERLHEVLVQHRVRVLLGVHDPHDHVHHAHQALHDPLTSLPNRTLLEERMRSEMRSPLLPLIRHSDIEVVTDTWGRPAIRLSGEIAEHLRDTTVHISLTHDGNTAAAVAILEGS